MTPVARNDRMDAESDARRALFDDRARGDRLARIVPRRIGLYFQKTLHIDKPPFYKPRVVGEGMKSLR